MLPSGNDAAICLANWGGYILSNKSNNLKNKNENIKLFVK